jgi:hypothetical protein
VRVRQSEEFGGVYHFLGVQLTAYGLEIIKKDTEDAEIGSSIEKKVADSAGADLGQSTYTKFGGFVGSTLGGFVKSIGSG